MVGLIFNRLWIVALGLVALTLCSAFTSGEGGLSTVSIIAIFAFAALKAELVLDNFMEAPHAEKHWQWLYRLWIGVVTIMLAFAFAI